jgi:delta1-piperideine-2-carboxylate reductase
MLFRKMLEQDGVRLPSDRRYEARQRTTAEGVLVPRSLHESIEAYIAGKTIRERNAYEGDHLTHRRDVNPAAMV